MALQDETSVENKAAAASATDGQPVSGAARAGSQGVQLAQATPEVIPAPGPGERVVVEPGEIPCFDITSLEGVKVEAQEGGLLVTLPDGGEILLLNVAPGAVRPALCLADGSFVSFGELIDIAGASLGDILPALGPVHGGGAGFSQPEPFDPDFFPGPDALPPTAIGPAPPILEPLVLPAGEGEPAPLVTFAIKVSDDGGTTFDQDATVVETGDGSPNTGIFLFSLSGVTLESGDTASVVVTVGGDGAGGNGTAMDVDFTGAVIAAILADAGTANVGAVNNGDGTVTLTWDDSSDLSFEVDLTAAADDFPDSPETLTLSLGTPLLNGSGANAKVPGSMDSADLTITDTEAVEFTIKVRDETETAIDFDQSATITEENNDNDTGTFRFSLSGVTLQTGDTASVVVTMSGTAEDADFTSAVIQAIVDQLPSGVTASGQTSTSVTLTWDDTAPASFEIDLESFDDAFPDSFETLTLSLGTPLLNDSGTNASVSATMGSADLTITDTDSPIDVLDGPFVTNTNQLDQKAILTFVSLAQPINAYSKWFLMDEQGQEGNIAEDAGFDINPAGVFAFSMENAVSNTTKIIVTDLTLEGVVIQDGGVTQISPDGSEGSGSSGGKPFAFTAVFEPDNAPTPDQGVTDSTDGTDGNDTGGSSIGDPSVSEINYLYGWEGDDTLNGGTGMDFLHGGEGSDVLNGGAGNDLLVFDGLDTTIDGGAGADILRVDGTTDGLADSTVSLTGEPITNIEVILLTEDAAGVDGVGSASVGIELVLDEDDVLAFADDSVDADGIGANTLYVVGTSGDSIDDLDGGWTDTAVDVNINGAIFDKFTAGGATLFVDQDIDSSGLLA